MADMNRRKFLGFLSKAPVAVAPIVGVSAAQAAEPEAVLPWAETFPPDGWEWADEPLFEAARDVCFGPAEACHTHTIDGFGGTGGVASRGCVVRPGTIRRVRT